MHGLELDGYRPGVLGRIIHLHGEYYGRHWKFGLPFERKVAAEIAQFLTRADSRRDLFLTAWAGERLAATITMDVTGGGADGAHLRWFIVEPDFAGKGLGNLLMTRAMEHCRKRKVTAAWLTTFAGLDAARKLYERHGFVLDREIEADQWSGGVREQWFRWHSDRSL